MPTQGDPDEEEKKEEKRRSVVLMPWVPPSADASKVPPSRFQKRKGSIYSTPSSRDGHIDSNYAAEFHAKHAEKGYGKPK